MFYVKDFTEDTDLKRCGVYMITHNKTNIKYIGSTISKDGFIGRWRSHLNGLNRGIGNRVLLNIKNKYGINGFRFKIIETIEDLSKIREREKYWIDYYDTYYHGANCSLNTECSFKKIKKKKYTQKDKYNYFISSTTKKTIYLYDEDGNLINTFLSTCECDRYYNLKKGTTSWAVNHPIRSICKKYYPSFIKKDWIPKNEKKEKTLKKNKLVSLKRKESNNYIMNDNIKQKIRQSNPLSKHVDLYDLNNNFIKSFNSLNECDDFLNLTRGLTSKVLKGKAKTLKRKYIPKLT